MLAIESLRSVSRSLLVSTLCTTVVGWISCACSTPSMPSSLMKSVRHIGVADTLNITNWNLWECHGRKLPFWRHSSLGESSLMTERLSAVVRRRQKILNQLNTIAFTAQLKLDATVGL